MKASCTLSHQKGFCSIVSNSLLWFLLEIWFKDNSHSQVRGWTVTNKKKIYIYIYNSICQSAPSSNYGYVFVQITEFAAYGSLEENLKKKEIEICQVSSLCKFAMQVANGMSYLANQNLVHRDLSARNILVFEPALVSTVFLWEHISTCLGRY